MPTRQPLYVSSSTQYLTLPDGIYELVPYPREAVNPFLTGEPGANPGDHRGAMGIAGEPRFISLGAGVRLTRLSSPTKI